MIDLLMPEKTHRNRLADRKLWDDTGAVWDLITGDGVPRLPLCASGL